MLVMIIVNCLSWLWASPLPKCHKHIEEPCSVKIHSTIIIKLIHILINWNLGKKYTSKWAQVYKKDTLYICTYMYDSVVNPSPTYSP